MRPGRDHSITGYVVRRVDYGESDRIVTLVTREEGRVDAIARGARRSKKRFEAGLSYYVLYEGDVQKQGTTLWLLKNLSIKKTYPALLSGMGDMGIAAYGTELVRELSPPHERSHPLYLLLETFYTTLNTPNQEPLPALVWLQYNLLAQAGFIPPADRCSRCEREGGEGQWAVSRRNGGVYCDSCAPPSAPRLPWEALQWLLTFPLTDASLSGAQHLLPLYKTLFQSLLGHPLKSSSLL